MKKLTVFLLSAFMLASHAALPGAAAAEPVSNPPAVLPAIREWSDSPGVFTVDGDTKLINSAGSGAAEKTAGFFAEMCGKTLAVADSPAGGNEIVFQFSSSLPEQVGDEGYTLDITPERITVSARTDVGLLYGGVTLAQMCFGEGKGGSIRCGSAVDWPAYGTRSGMLDVARAWIPLDCVKEITKYMAWFKLNEIHLHLSDNTGYRIESDFEGLATTVNGEKRYYTKDEYREYQKEMLEYGVSVVSELDTPSHSAPFASIKSGGPKMREGRYLDITPANFDSTVDFVKRLWAEYLTGDDPVFINRVVHIGTDEYPKGYEEQMRKFTVAIAEYVKSLGYIPRNWAFLGPNGSPGETPIPAYIQASMWDNGISGLENLVAGGYDIVNNLNARLYVVPSENRSNGFPDRLNVESLYKTWQVHDFSGWGVNKSVAPDYVHLLGAGFALWNDYHSLNYGVTRFDIIDRLRDMACIVAEKTWVGDDSGKGDSEFFMRRVEMQGRRAGGADPGYQAFEGEVEIDFSKPLPEGFSATGRTENGVLVLDGENCVSYSRGGVGFPNTLEITLKIDSAGKSPLMRGAGVELLADADGKGHLGFRCETYTFAFDYKLPLGEEVKLALSCDGTHTKLIVNDSLVFDAENITNRAGNRLETFNLPLEEVGRGAKGYIRSLVISRSVYDTAPLTVNRNLALERPVSVSGTEVDYTFFPEWAVDGKDNTRLSFAKDKDEQWLTVDLGREYEVYRAEVMFHESVSSFDIFVSRDGKDYTRVYEHRDGAERQAVTYNCEFDSPAKARYVKYVQNKRWYHEGWNTRYSGGILEFRVFGEGDSAYRQQLKEAKASLAAASGTDPAYKAASEAVKALESYLSEKNVYSGNLRLLAQRAAEAVALLGAKPDFVPGDVNGDGALTATDYAMAKRACLGNYTLSAEELERADIDGDGELEPVEYAMIKRHVLGNFTIPGAEGK